MRKMCFKTSHRMQIRLSEELVEILEIWIIHKWWPSVSLTTLISDVSFSSGAVISSISWLSWLNTYSLGSAVLRVLVGSGDNRGNRVGSPSVLWLWTTFSATTLSASVAEKWKWEHCHQIIARTSWKIFFEAWTESLLKTLEIYPH